MVISFHRIGLLALATFFVTGSVSACIRPNVWVPAPPTERVHLVYRVGEKFAITTPDSTDDFCRWQFIAYAPDEFYTYKDGIDFINRSGIIKFKKFKFKNYFRTMELRSYYDCLKEDQRIIVFKAISPGRVIFYMQNRPSWQIESVPAYFYGCSCSPTIREFIIDII